MKVLHLSTYAGATGAGRAAYSLHNSLRRQGVDSTMLVARSSVDDPTVTELTGGSRWRWRLGQRADRALWNLQRSENSSWRSPAYFGVDIRAMVERLDPDVVNLHWVTNGFMTVEGIGELERPTVWSMYDLWPISGTEHYGSIDERTRAGYTRRNRPDGDRGIDIDRWTWQRKQRRWRSPIHMVPASTWLAERTRNSVLARNWPVTRIPHAVDEVAFSHGDVRRARLTWNMDPDRPVIVFLASAGLGDYRKGGDLLIQALGSLREDGVDFQVLIAGPRTGVAPPPTVDVTWIDSLRSDRELRDFYRAASVIAVPSREDTLPLVALEAQMCGIPVVASDVGGLPDAIDPQVGGVLVPPGDASALARALSHVLLQEPRELAQRVRDRAVDLWSYGAVSAEYQRVYLTAASE